MRFLRFWLEFVVGDDWRVAAGLVAGLGGTALLAHEGMPAWWLPPVAVILVLADSLRRAARAEPGAGRSLRGSAPPRPSGTPSQLPANTGPGSGA